MRRAVTIFLLLYAVSISAQQQVQPVAGVLTLSLAPGNNSFKVIIGANVTSTVFTNPTPGTTATVIFTENATGGFTVAFGGNITATNCSVVTTANAKTICTFTYDASDNTWIAGGGGGGITSPTASTIYAWDPTYGVKGLSHFVCDAGITNNSNIVTTPSTDIAFASNVQGMTVWGSSAQCGGENAVPVPTQLIPEGKICTNVAVQAHQVSVCQSDGVTPNNATGTCTVSGGDGCVFVWGTYEDTGVDAAWVATAANCGSLSLPAGGIMLKVAPTANTSCPTVGATGQDRPTTFDVHGQGQATTLLFSPSSTCLNSNFALVPAQSPNSGYRIHIHDFSVAAFVTRPVACDSTVGFSIAFNSEIDHLSFMNYFPSTTGSFTVISASGVGNGIARVHHNIFLNSGGNGGGGSAALSVSNGVEVNDNTIQNTNRCVTDGGVTGGINFYHDNLFILCAVQGAMKMSGGGTIISLNDTWQCSSATSLACFDTNIFNGTVIFHNASIGISGTSGAGLSVVSGATVILDGEQNTVNAGQGTGNAITNAGTLTLRNTTTISAGGAGLANAATGIVNLKEGNTLSNGLTNASGGIFRGQDGGGVYSGACTGVVTSATTVGLYGLGQTSATTCTSTAVNLGRVMTKPGSVYALYCTATAGNQAADACTVVKNGVAQTQTCSLNGVGNCFDGTTGHVVNFVAGDILGIEAIAGTGTTLANVKGTLVTN